MENLIGEFSGDGDDGSGSGFILDFGSGEEDGGSEEVEDALEFVEVPKEYMFIAYIMRFMSIVHSIISLAMLVAYYHLKVYMHFHER